MTRAPGGEDRGWLGFDREQASAPADPQGNGAQGNGAQEVPGSPWLRHDLAADEGADADPAAAPGSAPSDARDPAWLEPELEVPTADHDPQEDQVPAHRTGRADDTHAADHTHDAVTTQDAADERHDTGVPPTLGAGAAAGAASTVGVGSGDDDATRPRTGSDQDGADDAPQDASPLAVVGAAVKEFAIVVGMALVLSFIVKTWLLQAFYIPSGSMEDTLVLNDRVIVSKLTPGPVDLKRGDIVVFADPGNWLEETPAVPHGKVVTAIRETMTFVGLLPDNSENHLIKRVIGLPGDHVVCCDEGGRITINGTAIKEPYLKPGDAASEQDFDITVPRGRVWVMGDHRSNSADSRAHDGPEDNGSQGSVDERLIVGRAVALVWPLDHMTWLSNPREVFAKVPAPSSDSPAVGQQAPSGPGVPGSGGTEVPGNDTGSESGTESGTDGNSATGSGTTDGGG
ncbi:signal peptidase I [Pedococcus sp. 2YAF34]|uniref:signal peptidase I n=1 Tax=Pedococcus sp. 2YAF34 TaxID=3233032 RepID=UPI003F998EBB